MAKTRTSRKSRTNPRAGDGRPASAAQVFAIRMALWVVVLALFGMAAYSGAGAAWEAVVGHPDFAVELARDVELPPMPDWVQAEPMRALLRDRLASVPGYVSVLGAPSIPGRASGQEETLSTPRVVHDLLADVPWIEEVRSVRKRLPNSLVVDATFRRPAGVALWHGRRHLIDGTGRWLGSEGELFRLPAGWDPARTPVIEDRSLQAAPLPGEPWGNPRLHVGARLNEFLQAGGLYEQLHVRRIDVTWVGAGAGNLVEGGTTMPEITLVTANGIPVKWGKSDFYAEVEGLVVSPTEHTDADKLGRLLNIVRNNPLLSGCLYVDLRFRPTAIRHVSVDDLPALLSDGHR